MTCDECDISPCVQCGMCLCSLITQHYSCGLCDWTWLEDSLPGVKRLTQGESPQGQQTFEIELPDRFSTAPPQTFSKVKVTIDGEVVYDFNAGDEEE